MWKEQPLSNATGFLSPAAGDTEWASTGAPLKPVMSDESDGILSPRERRALLSARLVPLPYALLGAASPPDDDD